jgi:hypothetical protein
LLSVAGTDQKIKEERTEEKKKGREIKEGGVRAMFSFEALRMSATCTGVLISGDPLITKV